MTFNHLFGLNGIYTCALGGAHGYGKQAIANLFFEGFQACRNCPYGRPQAMQAWPKVSVIMSFSCLYKFNDGKCNEFSRTHQEKKHICRIVGL